MMETLLIAGACILTVFVGFLIQMRFIGHIITNGLTELDAKLAHALKSTIENLPIGDIEPVNPMQMMIMQLIQDNIAKNPAKVIARDDKGLFTGESEPKTE